MPEPLEGALGVGTVNVPVTDLQVPYTTPESAHHRASPPTKRLTAPVLSTAPAQLELYSGCEMLVNSTTSVCAMSCTGRVKRERSARRATRSARRPFGAASAEAAKTMRLKSLATNMAALGTARSKGVST